MSLARVIASTGEGDLALAFARMGLPSKVGEYLAAKLPAAHLLLTGLDAGEGQLLKAVCRSSEAPGKEEFPAWAPGDDARPGTALLSGRREQFDNLLDELAGRGGQPLAGAIGRALNAGRPLEALTLGGRTFALGHRTYVMGVLNVTPDSFSDGGRYHAPDAALVHAAALVKAGADLLDVGGESTRPGAAPVSELEEIERVVPVIRAIRSHLPEVPVSVDTSKAKVAAAALEAGACLVNDVTGFSADPELPGVAARAGAAACVMHLKGTPRTMQVDPRYDDVVEEVLAVLSASLAAGERAGIPRARMMVDPGIGFGKTVGHNLFLLRRLADFRLLGVPVLVGTSRKSFLGHLTQGKPVEQRLVASAASVAATAVQGGADFVRVHDVEEALDAVRVGDAIRLAQDGGDFFTAPKEGKRPA